MHIANHGLFATVQVARQRRISAEAGHVLAIVDLMNDRFVCPVVTAFQLCHYLGLVESFLRVFNCLFFQLIEMWKLYLDRMG